MMHAAGAWSQEAEDWIWRTSLEEVIQKIREAINGERMRCGRGSFPENEKYEKLNIDILK